VFTPFVPLGSWLCPIFEAAIVGFAHFEKVYPDNYEYEDIISNLNVKLSMNFWLCFYKGETRK